MKNRNRIERMIFIAVLVALTVVLSYVDRQISFGLQQYGARIGFANIVILVGIYYLSFKESLLLVTLKAILSGLLLGNYMAFFIGLSGSYFSYLTMLALLRLGKQRFSFIGISLAGSIMHNIGQILVLTIFYNVGIVTTLIWLIPLSIATGILVGTIFTTLKRYLDSGNVFPTITRKKQDGSHLLHDK